MANRYYCKTSGGSSIIPVADATYLTDEMSASEDTVDVYFAFYSDELGKNPVTPTAGSILVHGEYENGFFLEAGSGATIDATSVSFPIASYTPPSIDGLIIRGSVQFSGITGASYAKVFFYKR